MLTTVTLTGKHKICILYKHVSQTAVPSSLIEQFRFLKTPKVGKDAFHSVVIASRNIRWLKNLKPASWAQLKVVG